MTALFKNNAFSTLASGITDVATSIALNSGDGAKFPSPTGDEYFYATLIDTSNNLEIVKCTSRSTDTLTVVREQESTTKRTYSAGDRIEMRLTAAGLTANTGIAKDWATKVDGVVADSEYSSKAYAIGGTGVTDTASKGAAKEWATETSGTVDGTSYSAKEYAQGTQASTGGSAKSWAQDTDQVNGASTNDRSAKNWAQGASMTGATLGGSSKDWAQTTGGTVDGSNYAAKEWAIGTSVPDGSAKDWAIQAEDSAVTGSSYSALHWAAKAEDEKTAAVADNFDDVYLGSKSSDPTVDNDGDALTEGDLYWNSSTKALKVYNGSSWANYNPSVDDQAKVSANDSTSGYLNGKLVAGSNVTFTENNDGSNETLTIAATDTGVGLGMVLALG